MNEQQLRDLGYVEVRPGIFERPADKRPGMWQHPIVQESKAGDSGQQNRKASNAHRKKSSPKEKPDSGRYVVRIDFRFCDFRSRDLDGCAATVLDALVAARRQLESRMWFERDRK